MLSVAEYALPVLTTLNAATTGAKSSNIDDPAVAGIFKYSPEVSPYIAAPHVPEVPTSTSTLLNPGSDIITLGSIL